MDDIQDRTLRALKSEPGIAPDAGRARSFRRCRGQFRLVHLCGSGNCSRVISVEPDHESCTSLRRNIAINAFPDVAVFAGAVGSGFEAVRMVRRASANSGTMAVVGPDERGNAGDIWVATMPLEVLLASIVRPPVRPVLMKIDVEGFERQVLSGLDFSGPFRPKNILMEFVDEFGGWGAFRDVQEFFAARNYRLCDVLGRALQDAGDLPEANLWAQDQAI
jgi:FkbM family methyltransferase